MNNKMLDKFFIATTRTFGKLPQWQRIILLAILLTAPVIFYCLPLLLTGNLLGPGDADYYIQTQEAARRSILEYHQFPWWNAWIAGGVPLYANPQFGLISIPTIFSLIFGSILGYKIALTFYLVMGFWGFFLLFRKAFKTPLITATLLCYVWVFCSFFASRIAGHYTFFVIQFLPFILYLLIKHKEIKYSWLWLGIALGMMINAAAHYATIMSLLAFGLFTLIELFKISIECIRSKNISLTVGINLDNLKFLIMSGGVTLLIAGQRLYYSVEYFIQYPRDLPVIEQTIGIPKALLAMFGPVIQYSNPPSIPNWSWMEASAYIGIATGLTGLVCLVFFIKQRSMFKIRVGNISPSTIVILGIIFFLLGLGSFIGIISPYNILQRLPVFSGMRVACRWLVWSSLMVIIFIALYDHRQFRKLINCLLLISVVELFIFGSNMMPKPYMIDYAKYKSSSTINQQAHFDSQRWGIPYDENLTATTKANIGQVIAGDSLIDTRQGPPVGSNTIRCDSDQGNCNFVLSKNAEVTYWSPNIINLKRTGTGPILLNMNPGKYWLVNDRYIFPTMRLAEPDKEFTITDNSENITIKLQPKFSIEWVVWKLKNH